MLSGTLVLSNPTKYNIWVDKPTVSVQPKSGRRQSAATFKCPALVRAQGQATCRFSAQWHTNKHPRSGLVAATVTISDSNKAAASKAVPFNFADAVQQTVGESARISSEWEPARGDVLLPKGTSGPEPPKNLLLAQGRKFKFSAVFEPDPYKLELCGRPWRVRTRLPVPAVIDAAPVHAERQAATASSEAVHTVQIDSLQHCENLQPHLQAAIYVGTV